MFSKVVTVTPAEATVWLDTKNSRNRPIQQGVVDRYAQEMKVGNWKMNGQAIIFGTSGQLLNGQHRLKACVQSGKSFETVVVYGIEDSTFDTMDDNAKRTLSDVFAIKGETNSQFLAPAVRFIWLYAQGQILTGTIRGKIATKKLLEETLDKHPGLRKSVKLYTMLKSRVGGVLLPASLTIGLHYLFSLVDERRADIFFTNFQSGAGLSQGDPIWLLRTRLISGGKDARNAIKPQAMYYYAVTAWNAYVKDQMVANSAMAYNAERALPEINGLPKSLMKDLL